MGNETQSGDGDDQSKQPGGSSNFANDRARAASLAAGQSGRYINAGLR